MLEVTDFRSIAGRTQPAVCLDIVKFPDCSESTGVVVSLVEHAPEFLW